MDLIVFLIFAVVFLCSYLAISAPKGIPPGPKSLPVVGSFFFNRRFKHKPSYAVFNEAAKEYGKIFSFKIGSRMIVVLHGFDVIHQALVKQAHVFSDRPTFLQGFKRLQERFGGSGIVFEKYNSHWKILRRFTLHTLRDFGVGKTTIEDKIMMEIDAATKYMEDKKGNAFEISTLLEKVVGNVIYAIVFGKRIDFNDPEFEMIHRMSRTVISGQGAVGVTNFFPTWVTRMFARKSTKELDARNANLDKIKEYIVKHINEHAETYNENNIRDFIDLYIQATKDSNQETEELFTKGTSLQIIFELFLAGTVTTFNTLDWAILCMVENPDIQRKCQQEIENIVGDKPIKYSDRGSLTYVDATITEIQRFASLLPLSVNHSTTEDTTLMGYHIPKDTIVFPSLYSSNNDPKYWKEPRKFNPDRFIDKMGRIIKHDALMPFSIGPRTCLGEPLARMELFMIFANFLQKFTFERADPKIKHSMEPKPNTAFRIPDLYKLRAISRRV